MSRRTGTSSGIACRTDTPTSLLSLTMVKKVALSLLDEGHVEELVSTAWKRSMPGGRRAFWRLLDDSVRTGVWADSVQVIGGQLSLRLPIGWSGVAHYRSAARRSP